MSSPLFWPALIRTVSLGLAVAAIAGAFGILLAWLTERCEFPGRRWLSGLLAVPYAIPAYLLGMAWVVLGNPTVGILRDVLPTGGTYGFWGIVGVETCVAFAFPYLELRSGFHRLDPALEEAARMSGAGPWRIFKDVSFPLLWPSLLSGMCLAFLYTISSFGVPAILGLPVRQFVLTTLIYSQLKMGGIAGLQTGLQLSFILLALAVAALFLTRILQKFQGSRGGAISGGKSSRPSQVDLGAWRWGAAALGWGLLGITVFLPWIALGISALAPVAGQYSPSLWTLKHLSYVLSLGDFREGLFNSILLTAFTASAVVAIGFLLAFASVRQSKRRATATIEALGLPFSTPGTVLAIALILISGFLARGGLAIDSAILLLGIAYALKYAAIPARSLQSAFAQVHPSLEEAARVSGARTWTLLRTIWIPLLGRNWRSAWILCALPMLTELTMSVLLTGPGAQTLGTVLFQLQEYADQPSAAALAWMLFTTALVAGLLTRPREEAS